MHLVQTDPSFVYIEDFDDDDLIVLNRVLTYQDLSAKYEYNQAKNNKWAYLKNPEWHQHVEALKKKIKKTALLEDKSGIKTYAGLLSFLKRHDVEFTYENKVVYPKKRALAYDMDYTPVTLWKHQRQAIDALLAYNHASIEAPTGSGKSFIINNLIKETGYSTIVVAPYSSIADALYDTFVETYGKKHVGYFGKNKKESQKRITVAVAAGLAKLTEENEIFDIIAKKEMMILDECHFFAANNLQKIALNVGKLIPVRYSVSATPERNDGQNTLLEGIIGEKVFYIDFESLVTQGVLAGLNFYIYETESNSSYGGRNSKRNSQEHYLYNSRVLELAAKIANSRVVDSNEPTIILIEEKEQLDYLKPYLTTNYEFAHSGSNVTQQVKDFNAGKFKLLIGTSAISTGTDTKVVKNLILLFSGKSTTKFKQAIGRGTRIAPGKTRCNIFDFHVTNDEQSSRHFYQRLDMYRTLSDNINIKET